MSNFTSLLERNRTFAAGPGATQAPLIPRLMTLVVACLDPRVEPASVLGIERGDAIVLRNAGGRVTDAVIADIALVTRIAEVMGGVADDAAFEIAVVHHTQCGTGFLADEGFRHDFAARTGLSEPALASEAVIDPVATVRSDVQRLLASPLVSEQFAVSGHVHDVETGLVTTVVAPSAVSARAR